MRLCARVRACGLSPVRLNPMSHIVSPICLDQLSPITSCNRFCESRFVGVTSQDFNNLSCVYFGHPILVSSNKQLCVFTDVGNGLDKTANMGRKCSQTT